MVEGENAGLYEVVRMCDPVDSKRPVLRLFPGRDDGVEPSVFNALFGLIVGDSRCNKPYVSVEDCCPGNSLSGDGKPNIESRCEHFLG